MTAEITNRKLWLLMGGSAGVMWRPYEGEMAGFPGGLRDGDYFDLTVGDLNKSWSESLRFFYEGTIETIEIISGYGVRTDEGEPWSVFANLSDAYEHANILEADELTRDIELAHDLRRGE